MLHDILKIWNMGHQNHSYLDGRTILKELREDVGLPFFLITSPYSDCSSLSTRILFCLIYICICLSSILWGGGGAR